MHQPYPSSSQSAGPLRPPAPAPVLTAVKLMYMGAAVSTVNLIISLAFIGGFKAALHWAHPSLTVAQVSQVSHLNMPGIRLAIVSGLVVIALWLWMARANGQPPGARILSTMLFGLATLELISVLPQPVIHVGFGATVLGPSVPVLSWLVGLAAVWLLWRPASSAFFRRCRQVAQADCEGDGKR